MATSKPEIETKYDVDDTTALPDLEGLPDVANVVGTAYELEATYFDTADLALGRRGITLRRRSGGVDAGWHLKLPVDGGRQEIQRPSTPSSRTPPVAFRRIVQGVVRDSALQPVATLSTQRTVYALRDAEGALLAEFCDDRVVGTRPGGGDEHHSWREWEIEKHAARRRLTKAADVRIRETGARPAAYGSKVGRVLQLAPTPADASTRSKLSTEHDLLGHHIGEVAVKVHRLDPLARADVPDAVHQLRVLLRRLRSTLRTFEMAFESASIGPVRDDLAWIGDHLGRPRDLEVLGARLEDLLLAESPELVRGRIRSWIASQLRAEHRTAHRAALEAMTSERYFALVDTLDAWRDAPPWPDERNRRANKRLPAALDQAWSATQRAAAVAESSSDEGRSVALHDVRKKAKRARYAAEALIPTLGSSARTTARQAKEVQTVLGDYHDAVVAADFVLSLADDALAVGVESFTLGVIRARLEADAGRAEREFHRRWKRAQRQR